MVHYKLTYFDGRARAEVSRMLFALAGVKYEDIRVGMDDHKAAMKKDKVLFGQVPRLEVDGQVFCQSRAIERFLARKFGFAGETEMEQFKVDMIMESMEDSVKTLGRVFSEQDEEKKAAIKKKWQEEDRPAFLADLEKILKSNKGGDGYFVGDKLTVADLSVVQISALPAIVGIDISLDKFPKLQAHKERVESVPKIAEWIANRPKTNF